MNNVLIVANFSAGRKQAIKYKKKFQKFLLIYQYIPFENQNKKFIENLFEHISKNC